MPGFFRLLATVAILGLALAAAPAAAQDIRIEPIPPHIKPQWTPVPNVSGVYYAPNLPTDVFRRGTKYYLYWEGYLYRSSKAKGPWKSVTQPPAWFSEIDPALFKTLRKAPAGPPAGPAEGATPAPQPPAPPVAAPPPPVPEPGKEGAPAPPVAPGQNPKAM